MKILAILLIAISVVCIQAQVQKNGAKNGAKGGPKNGQNAVPLPLNLVPSTIKILLNTPPTTTRAQVNSAISKRPTAIAGAAAIFAPAFGPLISSVAGFNIPLNPDLFVQKMGKVLKNGQFDKLTIFKTIIECMKTPPSGPLKQLILSIISNFVDSIAPALPGIIKLKPAILQTINQNNTKPDSVINRLLNLVARLPIVGGLFKYVSIHIYSVFVAGFEGLAAYRDNPIPILSAVFHIATSSKF